MKLQIVPATNGRDRWLLVRGNGIIKAWSAPKWLSLRSWLWKRSPQADEKRGG